MSRRMEWLVLCLLTLVLWSRCCLGKNCPPQRELLPQCWCYDYSDGGHVLCQGFQCPDEVVFPVEAIQGYNVTEFGIHNSTLTHFPQDLFVGTKITKITLFNTVLMSLSNGPFAFVGLEDTMLELRSTRTDYAANWNLKQLKKLKKLELIDINNIRLEAIEEEFSYLPQLKYIALDDAEISFIEDEAFAFCPNLTILQLMHNYITDLKRSMLPKPAKELMILRLDGNELSYLPPDFFTDMPGLEMVHLRGNKFVTISERPFGEVLSSLETLVLMDNPLHCDCRMKWLVTAIKRVGFEAVCESPSSLKGFSVRYLSSRDLYC